jgi:hypothetical protein
MTIKLQDRYTALMRQIAETPLPAKPIACKEKLMEIIIAAGLLDREFKETMCG